MQLPYLNILFLFFPIVSIVTDVAAIWIYFTSEKFVRFRLFFVFFTVADIILSSSGLILFSRTRNIYDGDFCVLQNSLFTVGYIYRSFGAFCISYSIYIVFSDSVFSHKLSYRNPLFISILCIVTVSIIVSLSLGCNQLMCSGSYFSTSQGITNYWLKYILLRFVIGAIPASLFFSSLGFVAFTVQKTKHFYKHSIHGLSNIIFVFLKGYKTTILVLTLSILLQGITVFISYATGICECRTFYLASTCILYSTGIQANAFFYYTAYVSKPFDSNLEEMQLPINDVQLSIHSTEFLDTIIED